MNATKGKNITLNDSAKTYGSIELRTKLLPNARQINPNAMDLENADDSDLIHMRFNISLLIQTESCALITSLISYEKITAKLAPKKLPCCDFYYMAVG
ncbi:MAG: hypothetical protein V4673_00950 [Pseudomonadota bacterium]